MYQESEHYEDAPVSWQSRVTAWTVVAILWAVAAAIVWLGVIL